jgi:dipeptidyl aminopeptidase/acylaminoacyl peptidase
MAGFSVTPRPTALVSFYGYGDLTGAWTVRPDTNYLKLDSVPRETAYGAVGGKILSESPLFPRVLYYNYIRQHGLWSWEVAALDPEKDLEKLEHYSPIRHLTREYPPTLLLHGDRDTDVPFEESVRMAEALQKAGVPHRLIRMHGYDHLFDVFPTGWTSDAAEPIGLKDPEVARAYDDVVAFLRRHVGR